MTKAKDATGLGRFEGKDVLSATVKITKAGDGLSKALAIEPEALHSGDVVYVVLKGVVGDIAFKPIKDTNGFARVQTIEAGTVTMVDGDLVSAVLEEQEKALEQAAGVQRLPFGGDDDPVALIDAVGMDPEKAGAPQLREWLKDKGLPATGTKAVMVGRVNDWWRDRKAENAGTPVDVDDEPSE
jgi:hypothetical protein